MPIQTPKKAIHIQPGRRRFIKTSAAAIAGAAFPWGIRQGADGKTSFFLNNAQAAASSFSNAPIEVIVFNRMAFGSTPEELEAFQKLGRTPALRFRAYVDQQLEPERIHDEVCDQRLSACHFKTLKKTLPQLWQDHFVGANALKEAADKTENAPPATQPSPLIPLSLHSMAPDAAALLIHANQDMADAKRSEAQKLRVLPLRETEAATWIRAVYSRRQLQEVLVDFWHDHFNVFGGDNNIAPLFVHYDRDVIRAHAFGNFRELLGAVAKSPAMLYSLDGFINQSGNPNENFARELFELHTLGVDAYLGTLDRDRVPGFSKGEPQGYVDGDVYEAARAFTGWRIANGREGTPDTGEFFYFDKWHDRFQKIILARPLQEYQPPLKDGEDVLDRVAEHPATSRHIAFKLCRRLIRDLPPARVVEKAAKVFRESAPARDQIGRTLRAILTSEEFKQGFGDKMKRPFESAVGMIRASGADFYPSESFLGNYNRAGQRLFQWPTPDGYPDVRTRWGGTSPMIERWRLANQITTGSLDQVKVNWSAGPKGMGRTPRDLTRFWTKRILGRRATAQTEIDLEAFLARGRNAASELTPDMIRERLPSLVALILMSPDFQLR